MSQPTHAAPAPPVDAGLAARSERAAISRVTGVAGIVTVVVVLGASLADGYQSQSMTEAGPAIIAFFRSLDDWTGWLMSYATSIGLIACVWFAIGLALTLRPFERGVPWRSAFLASAGVIGVVSGQIASWDAAVFRSGSISPQAATYAYDLGNISFANRWVANGAVGICAGLVLLRAPGLPRWQTRTMGGLFIASGLSFLAGVLNPPILPTWGGSAGDVIATASVHKAAWFASTWLITVSRSPRTPRSSASRPRVFSVCSELEH